MRQANTIIIYLLLLFGTAAAQYIGPNRPMTSASTAELVEDSLAVPHAKIDTLKWLWQWTGSIDGAEVTTANTIIFKVRMPEGPADSDLTKTTHLVQARHLWAVRDSGNSFYRVSADTTSPGMFYYLGPDNQMHRADGTTATKAIAAATDSVNKGSVCRFQYTGALALTRWQGLWAPGTALVNDSLTAGGVSALDTLRSAAKKMQNYATAGDSSKGEIILNIEPTFWTGWN